MRKTSKAMMLHEDNKTGGIGAEISALLAEDCFDCLDGPILRHRAARYAGAVQHAVGGILSSQSERHRRGSEEVSGVLIACGGRVRRKVKFSCAHA